MFSFFKSNEQKFKDRLEEHFYSVLKRSVILDSDMGCNTVVTFEVAREQQESFKLKCPSLIDAVDKISNWLRSNQNHCVQMVLSADSEDFEPNMFLGKFGDTPVPSNYFPMTKYCNIYLSDLYRCNNLIVRFYVEKES
ncbi:hypothetical protein [Kluyvera sichuanensis]